MADIWSRALCAVVSLEAHPRRQGRQWGIEYQDTHSLGNWSASCAANLGCPCNEPRILLLPLCLRRASQRYPCSLGRSDTWQRAKCWCTATLQLSGMKAYRTGRLYLRTLGWLTSQLAQAVPGASAASARHVIASAAQVACLCFQAWHSVGCGFEVLHLILQGGCGHKQGTLKRNAHI